MSNQVGIYKHHILFESHMTGSIAIVSMGVTQGIPLFSLGVDWRSYSLAQCLIVIIAGYLFEKISTYHTVEKHWNTAFGTRLPDKATQVIIKS